MSPELPAAFTREHGFTEADWLATLPGAAGAHGLAITGPGRAEVRIGDGRLRLTWRILPERRIALLRMPRLEADYVFEGVSEVERATFMRWFDLYIQRGGG